LVRTQVGDSDYAVKVVYAGSIGSLASLSTVTFPFVRTINVNVERTQVALHLPRDFHWLNFKGARQTDKEGADIGEQKYLQSEINSNLKNQSKGSLHEQGRAAASFSDLREQFDESVQSAPATGKLADQQKRNQRLLEQAQQAANEQSYRVSNEQDEPDNRQALNDLFAGQNYNRATNIVTNNAGNFDEADLSGKLDGKKDESKPGQFNKEWLENNSLAPSYFPGEDQGKSLKKSPAKGGEKGKRDKEEEKSSGQGQGRGEASGSFGNIARQIDKINRTRTAQQDYYQPGTTGNAMPPQGPGQQAQAQTSGGYAVGRSQAGSARGGMLGGMRDGGGQGGGRPSGQGGAMFGRAGGQNGPPMVTSILPTLNDAELVEVELADAQLFAPTSNDQTAGSLASVDLAIPERGATFYFQATRGEVELTAQPVRSSSSYGLATTLACLFVLAVVWAATRRKSSTSAGTR